MKIKLLKLHCTHAGFIRAGAMYGQTLKRIETREKSSAIGRSYRDWVAIASTHNPKKPNWWLVKKVAELAAVTYDFDWLNRLDDVELYKAGCVLAVARVANVWQMTESNLTDSRLEKMTGVWEPSRWAIELEDVILPKLPIPYNIPGQGAIYLKPEHHIYEEVTQLLYFGAAQYGYSNELLNFL